MGPGSGKGVPHFIKGPALVPHGLAVERRAGVLVGLSRSVARGLSAAHHSRWAAYALSLGFKV